MPSLAYDRLLGTREPEVRPPSDRLRARARELRASVDVERLSRLVAGLPGPRSRLHWPASMEAAEALVAGELEPLGWSVERQPFRVVDEPGQLDVGGPRTPWVYPRLDGENLVALRDGASRDAVVVVAHLDTVRDAPGADDNGSGVAAALEIGRLLAARLGFERRTAGTASAGGQGGAPRPARTLVLAFPDFEEIGLIGSRLLAERLVAERHVRAAIVLDTVGFRSREPGTQRMPPGTSRLYPGQARRWEARGRAGDFAAVVYRRTSRPIARAWAEALLAVSGADDALMLRDPADLPTTGALFRRVPATRNFSRSDHRRYWDLGIPALLISDTANFRNPHYHGPTDRPETLDYEFLADAVAATVLVVEALAAA
jgi:hypothetical protein